MSEMKYLGVENFGKDFQRLDDARARSIEVLIAIGDIDSLMANRLQISPFSFAG